MLRLSIIIPLERNSRLLEEGLVTVLENRPSGSEVLVVLDGPYDDPYDLQDEVQFVSAPGANRAAAFNAGLRNARGEFVHLLGCGVEVTAGWAEAAIAAFTEPEVAAVAPAIHHCLEPERRLIQGVSVRRGARRLNKDAPRRSLIGPAMQGGFYLREALREAGGLSEDLGDWADADLLLRLHAAGWTTAVATDSVLLAREAARGRGLKHGLHAERFFLKHADQIGFFAKTYHPCQVAVDCCAQWPHVFSAMGSLLGRSWAWIEQLGKRGPSKPASGQAASAQAQAEPDTSHDDVQYHNASQSEWKRIDGPHLDLRREGRTTAPQTARAHEWR